MIDDGNMGPSTKPYRNILLLDISDKNLTGSLDLNDFVNLELLSCFSNKLTDLKLGDKVKLTSLGVVNVEDYTFIGVVEENFTGKLWVTNGKRQGYLIDEKFNHIWSIEKV